jgi:hypothetical protein
LLDEEVVLEASTAEAIKGMQEKANEFKATGSEIYQVAK